MKILVVDDNPVNQRLAYLILTKAGYEVDSAADGQEAVDAVARHSYDAVIMDCEMPVLDGYQAAALIRQRESPGTHVPIIAVTASVMSEDVERALEAGMDAHVSKPLRSGELEESLRTLLQGERPHVEPEPSTTHPGGGSLLDMDSLDRIQRLDPEGKALREITGLFRTSGPATMGSIVIAAADGDTEAVSKAAHKLRGACGMVGAIALQDLCAAVEDQARLGAGPDEAALSRIKDTLEQTLAAISDEVARRLD